MLIEVKRGSKPNSFLLLVAVAAVAAGFYFYSFAKATEIAIVFGGVAVFAVVIYLLPTKKIPILIIDDSGVFDARLGVPKVFWSDIEDVSFEATYVGNRFLRLHLRDPEKYVEQLKGDKKEQVISHQDMGFKSLNVDIGDLEVSLLDLKAQIKNNYLKSRNP